MRLTRKRRQVLVVSLVVLIALVGAAAATSIGVFDQNLQAAIYDQLLTIAPSPPKNQVTIVGVDEYTVVKYGRWPVPRRAYVEALRALREARPTVIAFDIGFYDPSDRPQDDEAFAQEIRAAGNVILAMQGTGSNLAAGGALQSQDLKFPIKELREAAAGLGSVNVIPELDGRVRRANLVVTDGKERYYALPLVAAARQIRADLAALRQTSESLIVPSPFGDRVIPVDPGGEVRVYFSALPATPLPQQAPKATCTNRDEICVVSLSAVAEGKVAPELVRNRIVLVGFHSTAAAADDYPVPNSAEAKMWGVEIWGNVALAILTQRFPVLREGLLPTLLWLAVVTVAGVALVVRYRLLGFFAALGVLVAYVIAAGVLFVLSVQNGGIVRAPSIAYVAGGAPFWWVVVLGYLLVEEQASVRQTQRAFGLAVTPEIAKVILELQESGQLALGGQVREATVLFGDIRGFTTLSEGMGPAELMATLNRYFDGMVNVVQKYGGTVNKYNGDNIMVIWGVPLEATEHPRKAVQCALELQRYVVSERAKGGPDVSFGFGINSGQVVAGLLGAQGRFEYTVIGDSVNVASRLTSGDIARRDNVAVSEATLRALGDDVEAVDLGFVQVKGRAEAVHCFQINRLGDLAAPNPAPPPSQPIRAAAVAGSPG